MQTLDAARRGRDGDETAWEVLTAKIREVVLEGLVHRDLPPSHDADDLVAIVTAEIWRSIGAFDPDGENASFRGWVWTVRHRKLTDLWKTARRDKRRDDKVVHFESIAAETPGSFGIADPKWVRQSELFRCKELQECIDQAMASLHEKDREILELREEQGLDYAAIAERVGDARPETARSRCFRARERRAQAVRACLDGYDLAPEKP